MEGFDAGGYLQIDLERGELATRDRLGGRHVMLPLGVLASVTRAASDRDGGAAALYSVGRAWGETLGESFATELSDGERGPREATPAAFADRLAGVLATLGWGRANVETWGKALVIAMRALPGEPGGPERSLLAGVLAGVVSTIGNAGFACAVLERGMPADEARFLLGAPRAVKAARRWHEESGSSIGEVVSRLMSGQGESTT